MPHQDMNDFLLHADSPNPKVIARSNVMRPTNSFTGISTFKELAKVTRLLLTCLPLGLVSCALSVSLPAGKN